MLRLDDLQINGLKMYQDDSLFCFGCDAVELANFVAESCNLSVVHFDATLVMPPKLCNRRVCDLGAGNGIISILLAGKFGCIVSSVEILQANAQLIQKNAQFNRLDSLITVNNTDMQDYAKSYDDKPFDIVVCNPPYRKAGSGDRQKASAVQIARHELSITFLQVVASAARLLSSGGKFFFVHIAERMAECISICKQHKLEPKVLQILRPCDGKTPHLFMMQCIYDGKEGLKILPERAVRAFGM